MAIFVASFTIYTLFIWKKDFEITPNENVTESNHKFQSHIDPMEQFGCKGYWVWQKRELKQTAPYQPYFLLWYETIKSI